MKKIFCDATGKEIKGSYKTIDIPIHIIEMAEGKNPSYVDMDLNPTSGRTEKLKLSLESYNKIMLAAYNEFLKIREENKIVEKLTTDFKIPIDYKPWINPNINIPNPNTITVMYGVNPNPTLAYGIQPNYDINSSEFQKKTTEKLREIYGLKNDETKE